eukprot:TRINITY_DN3455_c0_g2_i3.p1 TRINITY_DN3455_c0_g2~~TRINITY_DN3455_c0_g2_i3.p1  ORF type:complete len:372 (+),score=53.18 TRINITY_DN3455_c0_g2_i3:122-1237(+)
MNFIFQVLALQIMLSSITLTFGFVEFTPQDCLCKDVPLIDEIFTCNDTVSLDLCDSQFVILGGYCQCSCGRCNAISTKMSYDQGVVEGVQTGDLNSGSENCSAAQLRCQEECGDIYSTVLQCDENGQNEICSCEGQKLDGLFRTFGVDAAKYGKQTFDDSTIVSVSASSSSSGSASATAVASASATPLDRIRSTANVRDISGQCTLLIDEQIERKFLETVNMVRGNPKAYSGMYSCDESEFIEQVSNPIRAALTLDPKLIHAANNHSCWQAEFDTIDHTGKEGSSPGVRAKWQKYDWALVGETLAYNYPIDNLLDVVLAWYCSPSHRDILASCFMVEAGLGIALNAKGEPYYTIMAACPKSDVSKCTCLEK